MLFTETDIKNLKVFLGRVQLSGAEAPVLVELVQKIEKLVPTVEIAPAAPTEVTQTNAG